ncbi:MAG: hypothetical protein HYW02_06990 [Deltaproteobacteria bacterium]|nr:hypothetical protein [Deltaproteobacteria bacterium]MBI4196566.1 hypothetical protein [Deltaproteobacteria bacterium]
MSTSLSTAEAIRCYQGAKIPLQGDLTRDELLWTLRRNQDIRISCYHRNAEKGNLRSQDVSDQYRERTSDELREAFRYARSTSHFRELTKSVATLGDQENFLHEVDDATNDSTHWSFYIPILIAGGLITAFLATVVVGIESGKKMWIAIGLGAVATGLSLVLGYQIHTDRFRNRLQEANNEPTPR